MEKKGISIRLKMILMIASFALLLGLTVIISVRYFVKNRIMEDYSESSWELASSVVSNIDADAVKEVKRMCDEIYFSIPKDERISSDYWGSDEWYEYLDRYKAIEETEEYKELYAYMEKSFNSINMAAVYIGGYVLDDKTGEVLDYIYLVDTAEEEDRCPVGTIELYYTPDEDQLVNGYMPYITNTEEYGWLMTAGVPITCDDGEVPAFMCIDVPMNDVMGVIRTFTVILSLFVVVLTLVLILIYLFVVDALIVSPINKLSKAALTYMGDNEEDEKHTFADIDIRSRDEIGNLFESMKQMETDINEHIENISKLTTEKERIKSEMRVAQNIQRDMLPSNFKSFCENRNFDIYGVMIPAKEVGGDFYDFFKIDKNRVVLVIGDVSGKGVPAALLMAVAKNMLRVRSIRGGSPADILTDVNTWLCENNESEQFITVFLGIIDMQTGKMEYANAGHEYPIIVNKDLVNVIHGDNDPPLAAVPYIFFKNLEVDIAPGDRILLYTDGVPEAKSENAVRYGMERLQRMLRHSTGALETVEKIKKDVLDFTGSDAIFDDVTMLCFEYIDNENAGV